MATVKTYHRIKLPSSDDASYGERYATFNCDISFQAGDSETALFIFNNEIKPKMGLLGNDFKILNIDSGIQKDKS
jgi:hypothetical protein